MAADLAPRAEAMSGELRVVLTCILLGAVGLTVGVITFSTLLPEIFGGRQGYVAGAVLLLLALAVLGLLEGAFECILGDDLLLPKHVAAVGTLFVITALNAAAVAVAINVMVQGSKPAAVLSLAVVLALLSTGHALLIRSQRRRHPHQKEVLSWLPSCLASVMLPFVGFWISVGPGIHAAAVAGACVIVSLGAFAPLAVGAPAFKRSRTAGLLQLLHALLALCSVLVTALGGQYAKGSPSLVVWPCCLAGVSTVHYLMTAAVRHPLFNKAESDDGGDGPAASLALLLHVVANVAGAIIVRCYDPKAFVAPGSLANWYALFVGCAAYYSSPSDFLYARRSTLAVVFFACSFWTGRVALLATAPIAVAAWWAMQMPWWRTRGAFVYASVTAAPTAPQRIAPETARVQAAPWYERSIQPSLFAFGVLLGVVSFVAVDWLDASTKADRWLLTARAFLLLPAALILADANRRRAVAGDKTQAPACALSAAALPLVAMSSLRGGNGTTAPDALVAFVHALVAVILLGVTSSKRLRAPTYAIRGARGCAMVAILVYVARLETFPFVTYVVAGLACVGGLVGAGPADEPAAAETVLGACALLLVAAISFLSGGDCGGGPSTFACSSYPLLALLPAVVVFHVLAQKATLAPSRTALLPDLAMAALVLAISCLPFAIAVVVQVKDVIVHDVVERGLREAAGAPFMLSGVILLMEGGLVWAYFRAPPSTGGGNNAVYASLGMVVLAATEVAMPLALAPTALFAVLLARMEQNLTAAVVATLTFLVRAQFQLYIGLYGLRMRWWSFILGLCTLLLVFLWPMPSVTDSQGGLVVGVFRLAFITGGVVLIGPATYTAGAR